MQLQCQDTWDDQTNQVRKIAHLIHNVVSIDQVTLRFFISEYVPDPKHVFLKIVKEKIPHHKQRQQSFITILTYCFYRIKNEKQCPIAELQMIESCYQQYIKYAPFIPPLVKYYQLVIKWADRLLKINDFVAARKELINIISEIETAQNSQLEILSWRAKLCLLMLETMLSKAPVERKQVLKLIKAYKVLKKDNKIAINSTIYAFVFLVEQLIACKSDLYIYFEMELKQLKKQSLEDPVFDTIQEILKRCEQFATKKIVSAVQVYIRQKIPIRKYPEKHDQRFKKIWHNEQINQDILRKADHFMRFRPPVGTLSANRTPRLSISLDQQQAKSFGSLHETTRLGWFKSSCKIRREESAVSLSKTGGVSRRKRRQIYRNINKDKQSESKIIKSKHLQDEMYEIESILQERCKITFDQILFGETQQPKKNEEPDTVKIVGATEDKDFGSIALTFFVIFNQEMAELRVVLTKHLRNYFVECFTQSTYCRNSSKLLIESSKNDSHEVTFDDLSNFVEGSIIYYEALQERVERKISIKELQIAQEMMRTKLNKQLSHHQLNKTLQTVELVKTQFFWYYTKSSHINGSRLEKRKINIEIEDQSAFAVCLGKFKSDYDCCLNQLIEVQNIRSLIQTCVYLSHGRLVVYRQLRFIKGKIYFEVITISDQVYKSFNRKGKIPYFEITMLHRKFFDLSKGKAKKLGVSKIDVRSFLSEEKVFSFFMKNIVQNFIEIKYLRKIESFLAAKVRQESVDWLDDRNIPDIPKYKVECVNNNEILQQVEIKWHLNEIIANFREILVSYASIYDLKPLFRIQSRHTHHFKIAGKAYIGEQCLLKNGLKVVKLFKASSRSTFYLFMYHQNPQPLTVIRTPFHSRVALIPQNLPNAIYLVNLIRNSAAQEYLINDSPNPIKQVLRYGTKYIYACISEAQTLLCWRLDLYFPDTQTHYFTLLDEQLYFDCLLKWNRVDEQVWRKALRYLEFDAQRTSVTVNSRRLKLIQVLKKMVVKQQGKLVAITLVKQYNQLAYMIVDYDSESLSNGRIDDIPTGVMHGYGASNSKTRPTIYSSLITRLYYQVVSGIVLSEKISSDYFQYQ